MFQLLRLFVWILVAIGPLSVFSVPLITSRTLPPEARPLTDEEWRNMRTAILYPRLKKDTTFWLADQSNVYNCIAWSLEITDDWVDPPRALKDFRKLYKQHGYIETSAKEATVDGYMAKVGSGFFAKSKMTHASRLIDGEWTSKQGWSYRIAHPRDGIDNDDFYGKAAYYFKKNPVAARVSETPLPDISHYMTKVVQSLGNVSVSEDFETSFNAWKATWFVGDMSNNQRSGDRATGPEWDALFQLGQGIIPQVVQKLSDPENNFAVVLYNQLQTDPKLQVQPEDIANYYSLKRHAATIVQLFSDSL